MKKVEDKIKEILFFTKKLPFVKQEEALDYVKWLWLSAGKKSCINVEAALSKMREIQSRHRVEKDWDSVDIIRKWREKR